MVLLLNLYSSGFIICWFEINANKVMVYNLKYIVLDEEIYLNVCTSIWLYYASQLSFRWNCIILTNKYPLRLIRIYQELKLMESANAYSLLKINH